MDISQVCFDKGAILRQLSKPVLETMFLPDEAVEILKPLAENMTCYDAYTLARDAMGSNFPTQADFQAAYESNVPTRFLWCGALLCLEAMVDREVTPGDWSTATYQELISNCKGRIFPAFKRYVELVMGNPLALMGGGVTNTVGVLLLETQDEFNGSDELYQGALLRFDAAALSDPVNQSVMEALASDLMNVYMRELVMVMATSVTGTGPGSVRAAVIENYDLGVWAAITNLGESLRPLTDKITGVVLEDGVSPMKGTLTEALDATTGKAEDVSDALLIWVKVLILSGASSKLPLSELTRALNFLADAIENAAANAIDNYKEAYGES